MSSPCQNGCVEFPFDASEVEHLAFYVYVYSDPRTDLPFYIGKGKGNRAFSHLEDRSETEKTLRIREIRSAGFDPRIEILAFGLDEESAYKVEAAAIDLIGRKQLTNRVLGHGARKYGRMSVETVHAKLSARPVGAFEHNCILIRIGASVEAARKRLAHRFDGASDESVMALYDATRAAWAINPDKARDYPYVLAVQDGIVREVYRVAAWFPAGTTHELDQSRVHPATRFEFVGRIAEASIRDRYRFRSVAHIFAAGDQNPIRYREADG